MANLYFYVRWVFFAFGLFTGFSGPRMLEDKYRYIQMDDKSPFSDFFS